MIVEQEANRWARERKSKRKMIKRLIIGGIVVFFIACLALIQCDDEKSRTRRDLHTVDQTEINEEVSTSDPSQAPAYNRRAKPQNAPEWLQGNWYVETEYGTITVKIHGDNIAESTNGETSYGHFKYQGHYLYCDYGDSMPFVYRVNEEKRCIETMGRLMKKRD